MILLHIQKSSEQSQIERRLFRNSQTKQTGRLYWPQSQYGPNCDITGKKPKDILGLFTEKNFLCIYYVSGTISWVQATREYIISKKILNNDNTDFSSYFLLLTWAGNSQHVREVIFLHAQNDHSYKSIFLPPQTLGTSGIQICVTVKFMLFSITALSFKLFWP